MQRVTLYGVIKTEADGSKSWAGYTTETSVPGLVVTPVDMLDPEDGSDNRWVLAFPTAVQSLDSAALETLKDGELRRATLAKLSDAELAVLGLIRS